MKRTDPPIIISTIINASQEAVWQAITDPDQMRAWYFEDIPDFKAEVGFETGFDVAVEDRVFPHKWRITEADPPCRITCEWRYENYAGCGYVTFELAGVEAKTRVHLINTITEDFPGDIPEFKRESCIGGWEYFIRQRLKGFLENPE
ncbi:SRPBCC family protein [Robiginitalea biformata]|uniref:Activator of Hsp90 ATPase homologue 1/2-like C-terminal domain-containing protein n=1 Tax=Robiginitalea biformata (strain ATCC BAA-864 / DSM 15991 / KCTC 12146 / HTCC2501) TaxID=313596 RepID=A4CM96_ROBBH|nr:SRPBCC domain-containing protein [Robiginitalea biformata]EAR14788.1 hypothetical protein RB2501_10697 [Robiginitalea biformata HTCC2501]